VLIEGDDILERWLGEEVGEVGEKKRKRKLFNKYFV
jgi:NTP pyrophosphatase (non-canonical NTP hydrolase)